mgnify:FL=1
MTPPAGNEQTEDRSKAQIREDLIQAASERLQGQGVDDFSTTKVADDCNTSRQMIYTLFGGKAELLKAVYDDTAQRLSDDLDAVEAEDPLERFYELGHAYRDFMLENAALFDRMLSLKASQNYAGPGKLITRTPAHDHFDDALEDCKEEGVIPEDTDVEELTDVLWAGVNGIIRLQLIGYYPDEETAREHYDRLAFDILGGESSDLGL